MQKTNQIWKQYQTSTFSIRVQNVWQIILSPKYFFSYIGIYNLQIILCIGTKDKENWCLYVIYNEFQRKLRKIKY
jgi:hypothetical protein